MCDLIALTRCCKLISFFLYLKVAVLLVNLKIVVFSSSNFELFSTIYQKPDARHLGKIIYAHAQLSQGESTLCPKKHVTTFSIITLTISVRLQ